MTDKKIPDNIVPLFAQKKQGSLLDTSQIGLTPMMRSLSQQLLKQYSHGLGIAVVDERMHNAYMLLMASTIQSEHASSPENLAKLLTISELKRLEALHEHGGEYLSAHGHSAKISPNLYTASIATGAMHKQEKPDRYYIGIIGTEAFRLYHQSQHCYEHPEYFRDRNTSPEIKALHLCDLIQNVINLTDEIHDKVILNDFISPLDEEIAKGLVAYCHQTIDKGDTALENALRDKVTKMEEQLRKTPVCDPSIILPFPER